MNDFSNENLNRGERMRMLMGAALANNDKSLIVEIVKIMGFENDLKVIQDDLRGLISNKINEYERCTCEDNFHGALWNKYKRLNNESIVKEIKESFPMVYIFTDYNENLSIVNNLVKAILLDLLFSITGYDTNSKVFRNYLNLNTEHIYDNLCKYVYQEGLPSRKEFKKIISISNIMGKSLDLTLELNSDCFDFLLHDIQMEYDKLLSYYLIGHLTEENKIASKILLTKSDRISIINIITNNVIKIVMNLSENNALSAISNMQTEFFNIISASKAIYEEKDETDRKMKILKAKYDEKKIQYQKLKESLDKSQNTSEFMAQISSLNKEIKQKNEDIESLKEIVEKQQLEIDRLLSIRTNNDLDVNIEIDPNIKILIAGGLPKTIAYIKELCPLSKAVTSETTPLNALEVDTFDMVLYFNDFSNHCITMRVKKYTDNDIKNVHIKQVYCYSTNKDQIKRTIYEAIKDIKKNKSNI